MITRTQKAQRTQWAAQFLAASELVRAGYTVSFTMGNQTPDADLMVGRLDHGEMFWVDVKGLGSNSPWMVREKPPRNDLFYILVRVGETRATDVFFILNHQQINDLISTQKQIDRSKGIRDIGGGFLWKAPARYQDAWKILPGWPCDLLQAN